MSMLILPRDRPRCCVGCCCEAVQLLVEIRLPAGWAPDADGPNLAVLVWACRAHAHEIERRQRAMAAARRDLRSLAAVAAARGVHVAAEVEEIVTAGGMTMADLRAPSRKRELVEVRRIVAIYLRQRGCSLPEIGRVLNRDHSTVLHLLRTTVRTETRRA
jgi:hypothetical protein